MQERNKSIFEVTKAYRKIDQAFKSNKRFLIIYGGSGSSKSYSVYQRLIIELFNDTEHDIIVFRKTATSIYNSVYSGFKNIIKNHDGINNALTCFKSPIEIKNNSTGCRIIFSGVDDPEKLKSIVNIRVALLEEATEFTKDDFLEINRRLRGIPDIKIILIFNPISHTHWIKKHFFDITEVSNQCDFVKCTYEDNFFMTLEDVKQLEDLKYIDENDYRIYAKGEWGILTERLIFKNWSIIKEVPKDAKRIPSGLDWGFNPDPTAMADLYIQGNNLIIDELIYKRNLVNIDFGNGFSLQNELEKINFDKKQLIIADSAEPKSIMELRYAGYNIIAVQKPGIFDSLRLMKSYNIQITERSKNTITEFENYMHKIDKEGNILPDPIDDYNHCFDRDTKILTKKGLKNISKIRAGEYVLTSKGYKKVLKSGVTKYDYLYTFKIDTLRYSYYICCTKDHKFKTSKGWKEVQSLQQMDILHCLSNGIIKDTFFTSEKDITGKGQHIYIEKYGNIISAKYLKDVMYIILMVILSTMKYQILKLKKEQNTYQNTQKNIIQKTKKRLKNTFLKLDHLQKNGIQVRKAENGIKDMPKILILGILHTVSQFVVFVKKNLKNKQNIKNSAQTTVNQNTEEEKELIILKENAQFVNKNLKLTNIQELDIVQKNAVLSVEVVNIKIDQCFDLTIQDEHEFFANGILVHNCIDGIRYVLSQKGRLW